MSRKKKLKVQKPCVHVYASVFKHNGNIWRIRFLGDGLEPSFFSAEYDGDIMRCCWTTPGQKKLSTQLKALRSYHKPFLNTLSDLVYLGEL